MGNITGQFRSIDTAGLRALKQAADNDGQVDASEILAIEEAVQQDGNVSEGEHQLIQQLRAATQDGNTVQNLQLAGFDPVTPELSFDVQFGANNQGSVTPESAENYVNNLTQLSPGARTQLTSSLRSSGLSSNEQKLLAQTLNRTGTPAQVDKLVQALHSSSPANVQEFGRQFLALSPAEQQATVEIAEQLQQNPAPANLAADLRTRMAGLPAPNPPDRLAGRNGVPVGRALNQLGLYLPPTNPSAPGVEDASGRLSNAVMGGYTMPADIVPGSRGEPYQRAQNDYVRDMIGVAQREDFQVTLQVARGTDIPALKRELISQIPTISTEAELDRHLRILPADSEGYTWAEDNKWIAADGTVVTTPDADAALDDAYGYIDGTGTFVPGFATYNTGIGPTHVGAQGHHTAGQPANDPLGLVDENSAQGAVTGSNQHRQAEDLSQALGRGNARTTRTYNEGGNMLVGSFPNGDPYAVIGNDGLLASTYQLRRQGAPEFAPANITARQQQMGLDQPFNTLPAETQRLIDDTAQRLIQGPLTAANTATARTQAIEFLVQQDITKDIFATDVGVARENLIFVDQPEFHIDMHMRPLGPGQIMVNDFAANETLLRDALSRATPGSWEATELQNMLDHNTDMARVMGPVMDRIRDQLTAGGLTVVPAPGVMEGDMANPDPSVRQPVRHVNFMNAIPSTRPGTNQQFLITNYTSIAPLRAAFEAYAQTQGIEQVYWTGDDGGGERFKSNSEFSLWPGMGGLDCRENH